MITKPRLAHTLLNGIGLAACTALPAGSTAQTAPPTMDARTLGSAISEALRSPFHASTAVKGLPVAGPGGISVPRAEERQSPDSARGPSFHRVFWPTLAATALTELLFLGSLINAVYCQGSRCGTTALAATSAAMVLGPPAAASLGGGSFAGGLLGSAAGLALGWGLFQSGTEMGLDDFIGAWAIPVAHALLTTFGSIAGSDL